MTRKKSELQPSVNRPSLELLTEREVGPAVGQLVARKDDIRVAVAFWGGGGAETLGLTQARAAKVLCNLNSGSCDPGEVRRLMDQKFAVRAHDRLHAKVYWTAAGVVVGSSNTSTNGLATPGNVAAGWCEANLLTRDPAVIEQLGRWFDERWSEGQPITKPMLKAAQERWDRRSREARLGADEELRFKKLAASGYSLLEAVAAEPELFNGQHIYINFFGSDNTKPARNANAIAKQRAKNSHDLRSSQKNPLRPSALVL